MFRLYGIMALSVLFGILLIVSSISLVTTQSSEPTACNTTIREFQFTKDKIKNKQQCLNHLGEPVTINVFKDLKNDPISERWEYEQIVKESPNGRILNVWIWWSLNSDDLLFVQYYDPNTGEVLR